MTVDVRNFPILGDGRKKMAAARGQNTGCGRTRYILIGILIGIAIGMAVFYIMMASGIIRLPMGTGFGRFGMPDGLATSDMPPMP